MVVLFDNISIKVVALVLGLLLWFHVATEKVYDHQLQLPVTDIFLKEKLTLSKDPPDSVMVLVSASGKQLLRRKWRERGLRINAAEFTAGRHRINLTPANTSLVGAGNLVSLDAIVFPTTVELFIDRKAEVRIPVTTNIVPLPDQGYAVSAISSPEPAVVTLVGPRSLLGAYSTVYTEHKELVGLRNNLTLTLPLVKPVAYGISLEPDSVTLTVEVVPVKTKVFTDIPILFHNFPRDTLAVVGPDKLTVVLTGPPDEIDLLPAGALVASADFRHVSMSGKTPVKVDCPPNFRVKSRSVDSVTISAP